MLFFIIFDYLEKDYQLKAHNFINEYIQKQGKEKDEQEKHMLAYFYK